MDIIDNENIKVIQQKNLNNKVLIKNDDRSDINLTSKSIDIKGENQLKFNTYEKDHFIYDENNDNNSKNKSKNKINYKIENDIESLNNNKSNKDN